MSIVQRLCYILCVDFLKSFQSSVFTQPRSTAVSTHLITHTTASFHSGKFGDDRYSSFVVEKNIRPKFGRTSVLVRPVRRNIRLRPNIVRGMFGASLIYTYVVNDHSTVSHAVCAPQHICTVLRKHGGCRRCWMYQAEMCFEVSVVQIVWLPNPVFSDIIVYFVAHQAHCNMGDYYC